MPHSLSAFVFVSALVLFVGCGGGDATDSDAVAEGSNEAASPSGSEGTSMTMPNEGAGGSTGGDEAMMGGMGAGMMGAGEEGMMSADGAASMEGNPGMEAMMAAGGLGNSGDDPAMDMAGMEAAGMDPAMDMAGMEAGMAAGADMAGMMQGEGLGGAGLGMEGGIGGLGGVAEKVPDTFEGKATLAFRSGKDRDAMQYLYAHALTTDAGAESLLPTIRWVGGLKKPALAVRWGAGFVVTAPRSFSGDAKPIGVKQKIPTRGGNRSGGGDGFGGLGGADAGGGYDVGGGGAVGKGSLLTQGAGELAEKLIAEFSKAAARGEYGEVLKTALQGSSGGGPSGLGGLGGDAMAGMGGMGGGMAGMGGGGGGAVKAADKDGVTSLMPGLAVLGIGTQKELIGRALDEEIDVVVIINMKLSSNTKTNLVTNETTLALFNANAPRSLYKTRKLNNLTVQKAREAGKEDGVDRELGKLFDVIDSNFKMKDLPTGLTPEIAAKRVASLAAKEQDNPLPVLAEAKMYHSRGMLTESQLFEAYEKILGVEFGRLLATGSEEEKAQVLEQWLPTS